MRTWQSNRFVTHDMARVIHVQKVLETMRMPQGTGSFTIEVKDAFLSLKTRAFMRCNIAMAVCRRWQKVQSSADLCVDIADFTSLRWALWGWKKWLIAIQCKYLAIGKPYQRYSWKRMYTCPIIFDLYEKAKKPQHAAAFSFVIGLWHGFHRADHDALGSRACFFSLGVYGLYIVLQVLLHGCCCVRIT